MEVERLQREYLVEVRWAPYLLDPTIPPEGKQRKPYTTADTPQSHLEQRAEAGGLTLRRGRGFTPSTRLALEAAEFAYEHGQHADRFHRALFKANFEDFDDIGDADVLVRIATEHGLDGAALHEALLSRRYRGRGDERTAWARPPGLGPLGAARVSGLG